MKKYDLYKDSGVKWIGKIPSGWENTRLKFTLQRLVTGGTPDTSNSEYWGNEENGINWISISDMTSNGRKILSTKKYISAKGLETKKLDILPAGSLIYSIYGSIGKISRLGIPSTVHQGILGLITKSNIDSVFLEYYLMYFKEYVNLFSSSNTQENLNQEKVSNFEIPLPPLYEQQQIVAFLDSKTSLIDSLIEKTKRKIALLTEKRTALINEVVTKGLNPNAQMKDSGVKWIGKIPMHWEIENLKYFCKMIHEKGNPNDQDIKISPENIESNTGICFNLYSEYNGEGIRFEKGDILLSKLRLYLKKIIYADYVGYSMGEMIVLRITKGISKFYFRTFFHQGLIDVLDNQSIGVKMPRVSPEIIMNSPLPFPPLHEQQQIVDFLDRKTSLIDKSISIEEKKIKLLQEYRKSLISEVVTGKQKVVA